MTATRPHEGGAPTFTKPRAGAARLRLATALAASLGLALAAGHAQAAPAAGRPVGQEPAVCSQEWLHRGALAGSAAVFVAPPADQLAAQWPHAGDAVQRAASLTGLEQVRRGANDTYFELYQRDSLMAMGALDAWDTSRGGSDVVIAVISTGVLYTHPDLGGKIWHNPGEVPGNGVDDDHNGYVDDVMGWSFPDQSSDPIDIARGKGTMMAGIAAAETNNNEGIAGVSWGARIMALKTLVQRDPAEDRYVGTVGDQVEAVCYAANNGAGVILLGGYLQDPANAADDLERLRLAVEYAHLKGAVVVAPAGDCGKPQSFCPDFDRYGGNPPIFPAGFNYVIGVQTYGANQAVRGEASCGPWVDISAPGEGFMSTTTDPPYSFVYHQKATSDFGAAHVAGVAAVIRSVNPDLSPYQVEQALFSTATRPQGVEFDYPPDGLPRNDCWGYGVVNFEKAVESVPPKMRVNALSGLYTKGSDRSSLFQLTDGSSSLTKLQFENQYLSAGAWELDSDVSWVDDSRSEDRTDGTSRGDMATDLVALSERSGPLEQGTVYTAAIHACATDWDRQRSPCQQFTYRLLFVDQLAQAYLPIVDAGR